MRVMRHECSHCGRGLLFEESLIKVDGSKFCPDCARMFESMIEHTVIANSKERESTDDLIERIKNRKGRKR